MRLGLGLGLSKNNFIPSSGESFILDTITALNAYSLRKLKSSATKAIRVRRSSDNQEQDIGFVGEDLDEASLLAFVGAGDGFVTTLYDQVGNINFTQPTLISQPQIVASGNVIKKNSKASIDFDSNVNPHSMLSALSMSQNKLYSVILSLKVLGNYRYLDTVDNTLQYLRGFSSGARWQSNLDGSIYTPQNSLVADKLTNVSTFVNNEASYMYADEETATGTLSSVSFNNLRIGNNTRLNMSELIILSGDASRINLKTNQDSYYSIV